MHGFGITLHVGRFGIGTHPTDFLHAPGSDEPAMGLHARRRCHVGLSDLPAASDASVTARTYSNDWTLNSLKASTCELISSKAGRWALLQKGSPSNMLTARSSEGTGGWQLGCMLTNAHSRPASTSHKIRDTDSLEASPDFPVQIYAGVCSQLNIKE